MTTCCAVLSPQEQRLQEEMLGKESFHGRTRAYDILKSIQTGRREDLNQGP